LSLAGGAAGGTVVAPENGDALDSAMVEKLEKCLQVYRRIFGIKPWQLLPEHRESLDRFEKHLVRFAVSLIVANIKRFMWVSSSARTVKSLRSGSLSFCRSDLVASLVTLGKHSCDNLAGRQGVDWNRVHCCLQRRVVIAANAVQ
jgi:hypothetical protein